MKRHILTSFLIVLVSIVTKAQEVVWDNLAIGYSNIQLLEVRKVSFYADKTEIDVALNFRAGRWMSLSDKIYLQTDNKHYAVKNATTIELNKKYTLPTDTVYFSLIFEALPKSTQIFDIVEAGTGGWQAMNIRNAESISKGIADTYWRSEETGDWVIGIAERHVVYKSEVWDIVDKTEKKDSYALTLSDGTKIKIGRLKKGCRDITIGKGKAIRCSQITGKTLPDYPTKDLRKGFVDNGYNTKDSVIVVGWLKDMPQEVWKEGEDFKIEYGNIFDGRNQCCAATGMDSMGRFRLKIPLLNTSQVFVDWRRATKSSVLEPGKTYFFLQDFKTGVVMWMGDDVRLQNELLAYPHEWPNDRVDHKERGKTDAMKFWEKTNQTREKNRAKLRTLIAEHPTLSTRYVDYIEGYYQTGQGESMMQARFAVPKRELPSEYMEFVWKECWQKASKPYTLYRDFTSLTQDYVDQLKEKNKGEEWGKLYRKTFEDLEKKGVCALSEKELATIDKYIEDKKQLESDLQKMQTKKEFEARVETFNTSETTVAMTDIGKALELEQLQYREVLAIIEETGCDEQLRDILFARQLCMEIDRERKPLSENAIELMRNEIRTPVAVEAVMAMQEKYVAIQKEKIENENMFLKLSADIANKSNGEEILSKIIEPYRGKMILLDVWGTWCMPCKMALSHSAEEYERQKGYDLVYLYLANNSSEESWKNVIKEYNVVGENVVHYNLPEAQQSAIENYLNVTHFPTYKLIDREGKVLDVNADPRDIEALARLLDKLK